MRARRGSQVVTAVGAAGGTPDTATTATPTSAAAVLTTIYDRINKRDVDGAMQLVDDKCVYEDFNFETPFRGAEAVRELFEESCEGIPDDLLFIVDDITGDDEDSISVGMTWHVELNGVPFPNGRGCSFYRIDPDSRKLVYGRDIVEPPLKPGPAAFSIIRAVAPIIKETGGTPPVPTAAVVLGAAAAWYTYWLILSPPNALAPGEPIWAIRPETLKEVVDESYNFFFVNVGLNSIGINLAPDNPCNPVSEGLFNLVNAYSFLYFPVLLKDKRSVGMNTVAWWSVQMFLTNAVMTTYLAKREILNAKQLTDGDDIPPPPEAAAMSKAFGIIGGGVAALSLWWAAAGRGDIYDLSLAERWAFFQDQFANDRVTYAFMVDMAIYSTWQPIMLGELDRQRGKSSPAWQRFTPVFGMAGWLLSV